MSLKAFEIVPVIDKINLGNEKSKVLITCIDCSLTNMYIGTSDCFVVHYVVEKSFSPTGKLIYQSSLQKHKHLGLKKSIQQLLTCPAASKLLVLCDGNLYMLSMSGLEMKIGSTRELMKGATVMSRNDRPVKFNPFSVEVCIGTKKKSVQIWSVDQEKITVQKEINLPESPSALAIDGITVCTTIGNQYFLINYSTGKIQELFMYEAHNTRQLVKRVGQEEFLLSGPTNTMGMVVTSEGLSQHQPLNWADGLTAIGYSYPYVLVLGNSTITVHSMLDQRQKQAIAFQGGVSLGDFDSGVFVMSQRSVYSLVPIPLDKQIQMLLIEKRVEEAIELSIVTNKLHPSSYDEKFLTSIQAQAGFVYFAQGHFSQASELFRESRVDVREIIALYPSLMPSNVIFQPSRPTLHNIKDLNQVVKGSKTLLAEAKKFILDFLEACRGIPLLYSGQMTEIDTSLLKLYAECNHSRLLEMVAVENSCYYEDSTLCLKQYKRFHALALLHCNRGEADKALEYWRRLADSQDLDLSFPGIDFLIEFLSSLQNHDLVWTYATWILEKDQENGVKIFIDRPADEVKSEKLRPEAIVEYLSRFPIALRIYLENLVIIKKIEKEIFHTHLAVIYLDEVLKIMKERIKMPERLHSARQRLQDLLELSSLYRVSTLLNKIGDLELHNEVAILYGKLDQHDKAIQILVHKLKDHAAAERYCMVSSQLKDASFRRKLFHMLLAVYLQPNESGQENQFLEAAIQLINTHQRDLDPLEALQMIPDDWAVGTVANFLSGAMRNSLHTARNKKLESSLTRSDYITSRHVYIKGQNGAICISDERERFEINSLLSKVKITEKGIKNFEYMRDFCRAYNDRMKYWKCDVCHKPFTEPTIARYPNGLLTHVHCAENRNKCPVTQVDFLKNNLLSR